MIKKCLKYKIPKNKNNYIHIVKELLDLMLNILSLWLNPIKFFALKHLIS